MRNITVQQSHRQASPTSRYIMFLTQARGKEGHGTGNGAMDTFHFCCLGEGLLSHAGIDNAEKNLGLDQSR